jgi:hypothetical protein
MSMARLAPIAGAFAAALLAGTDSAAMNDASPGPIRLPLEAPQTRTAGPGDHTPAAADDRNDIAGGRERRSAAGDGGLPEPASWVLMLIGVGMIGGALRGFVVTNRNLARLQPEDVD